MPAATSRGRSELSLADCVLPASLDEGDVVATPDQPLARISRELVSKWILDEKLDRLLQNEPKVVSGKVVARVSERVLVA